MTKKFLPKRYRKNRQINPIPVGHYCYVYTGETSQVWNKEIKQYVTAYHTKHCPFYKYKTINGVYVPYCSFLKLKGWNNNWTSGEWDILEKRGLGFDNFPLSLLWDSCKECGRNYGDENEN